MATLLEDELERLMALLREPCDSNDRMDARGLVRRLLLRARGHGLRYTLDQPH